VNYLQWQLVYLFQQLGLEHIGGGAQRAQLACYQ
jgi:hypothetical protein